MARQKCHWQKAWWRKAAYFITAKKQRKKEKAMGRTLRLRDAALELEIAEGRPWNRGTDPVRMMNGVPALKGSPHVGCGVDCGHWHSRVKNVIVTRRIPDLSAVASAQHRAPFYSA